MIPKLIRSLFVVFVFMCGVLAGALLQTAVDRKWLNPGGHLPVLVMPPRASTIEYFRKELWLSAPQVEQLNRVLDDALRDHGDANTFTQHIKEETRDRIREMLDRHQRARFEEILNESPSKGNAREPTAR